MRRTIAVAAGILLALVALVAVVMWLGNGRDASAEDALAGQTDGNPAEVDQTTDDNSAENDQIAALEAQIAEMQAEDEREAQAEQEAEWQAAIDAAEARAEEAEANAEELVAQAEANAEEAIAEARASAEAAMEELANQRLELSEPDLDAVQEALRQVQDSMHTSGLIYTNWTDADINVPLHALLPANDNLVVVSCDPGTVLDADGNVLFSSGGKGFLSVMYDVREFSVAGVGFSEINEHRNCSAVSIELTLEGEELDTAVTEIFLAEIASETKPFGYIVLGDEVVVVDVETNGVPAEGTSLEDLSEIESETSDTDA